MEESDSIDNIKALIIIAFWLRGHSPGSSFTLLFEGVELRGEWTIGQLGIRHGDDIIIRADYDEVLED